MVPIWKQAPFIRLLIPLIAGIVLQWYFPLPVKTIIAISCLGCFLFLLTALLRGYSFFRYKWLLGVIIMTWTLLLGMALTHFKNITHQQDWVGHYDDDSTIVAAVLTESLMEKNKSYKANARLHTLISNNNRTPVRGNIIIYFEKAGDWINRLDVGSILVFRKPLQIIKNPGNPGAFDYRRYCLFRGITHQVYLKEADCAVHPSVSGSRYERWVQGSRREIMNILQTYIQGRSEAAVAEALLIGYRGDLDQEQLQSFANAGVIHVIAISGMHLGIIYGLLVVLLKPLQRKAGTKWLRGLILLMTMWLFAVLTGSGASILRSAVMFSFIVVGESMRKKVSVYHTLSASAFFLLCWDPFLLWDVGFQLSYMAVLSIVIFSRAITCWFYFKSGIMNYIWKLMAVTLAAQILTTPLSIYYFHQMSNLFLPANLVIVPLSGIILYGEILLCLCSPFPLAAAILGKLLSFMLAAMNGYVMLIDSVPFAVSNNFSVTVFQTGLFFLLIITAGSWLMKKKARMLIWTLGVLIALEVCRMDNRLSGQAQQKLVVYNTPGYKAVDFVQGRSCRFAGDSRLLNDPAQYNYHLRPARLALGVEAVDSINGLRAAPPFYYFQTGSVLLLDSALVLPPAPGSLRIDVVVLSRGADISISRLYRASGCRQYVFDASCPLWKIRQWKNECDSLHLRRHSVVEEGAYVLDF
ncbi:MAG: competence protein ComEC family protein [Chitinophagaceae bacterium]|nr:competence protein ComEC family protein [Chitinophagaceae bacterium]